MTGCYYTDEEIAEMDSQHAEACAERNELRAAMREAGPKVFGGNWIDHGVDCRLGIDEEPCTCGLSDWLTRNAKYLGISFPVTVSLTQEKP